ARIRGGGRPAEPLHPRDDPAARAAGQKLAAIRRRRRRRQAARAAVQDLRRRADRPANGVERRTQAADERPLLLDTGRALSIPLPRLRERDREGARDKTHACKLTPSPTLPRRRGREHTEFAALISIRPHEGSSACTPRPSRAAATSCP